MPRHGDRSAQHQMARRIEQRHAQFTNFTAACGRRNAIEFSCRVDALHGSQHTAGRDEVPAGCNEILERRKGARDDDGERFLGSPVLDPPGMNAGIFETQFDHRLSQEGNALGA